MTALWISLAGGVLLLLLLVWRLRKASGTLNRILREERERTARDAATEGDIASVERRRR